MKGRDLTVNWNWSGRNEAFCPYGDMLAQARMPQLRSICAKPARNVLSVPFAARVFFSVICVLQSSAML
jgi:hypothetical protein